MINQEGILPNRESITNIYLWCQKPSDGDDIIFHNIKYYSLGYLRKLSCVCVVTKCNFLRNKRAREKLKTIENIIVAHGTSLNTLHHLVYYSYLYNSFSKGLILEVVEEDNTTDRRMDGRTSLDRFRY